MSKRGGVTVREMAALVTECEALNDDLANTKLPKLHVLIMRAHDRGGLNSRGSGSPAAIATELMDLTASIGCGLGRSTYVLGILQNIDPNHPEHHRGLYLADAVSTAMSDDLAALKLVSKGLRRVRTSGLGASKTQSQSRPQTKQLSFAQRRGVALTFERLLTVGGELIVAVEAELEALRDGAFEDVPADPVYSAWLYGYAALCHADRILHDVKVPSHLVADLTAADKAVGILKDQYWSQVALVPLVPRSTVQRPHGRPAFTVVRNRSSR